MEYIAFIIKMKISIIRCTSCAYIAINVFANFKKKNKQKQLQLQLNFLAATFMKGN